MPLNVKCRTEDNVRLTAKLCGIIENMNMNLLDFINATVNLQLAEAGGVLKSTQHSPLSCVYGDKSRSNPGSKATVCSLKTSPDPSMSVLSLLTRAALLCHQNHIEDYFG